MCPLISLGRVDAHINCLGSKCTWFSIDKKEYCRLKVINEMIGRYK
jgi:hypothetical protein